MGGRIHLAAPVGAVTSLAFASKCSVAFEQKASFKLSAVAYEHIQGVMALTLFEDFVYWTDGKSKSLRRAHKTTGTQGMELLNSWQAIKSIKVYHSLRQPEGIPSICLPCPVWSHVFSVLCLSSRILPPSSP